MNNRLMLPLIALMCGCSTGIEVADFKPAQKPEGVHMELTLNGNVIDGDRIKGELLAVREDMGRAKVVSRGQEQNRIYLNRLRLVSRFPQGMSDELIREPMNGYGQTGLETPHRTE